MSQKDLQIKWREIINTNTFWKLVENARNTSGNVISLQAALLIEKLTQLPEEQILAFHEILNDLMNKAYDAALWDAAFIIGCGCSDDGFYEFRGWLIAQGKDVYEKALADPESLVDLVKVDETAQQGHLLHVAPTAYEQRTGKEMHPGNREVSPLRGELWPEEEKNARFPKLAAKFGDCDQRDAMWFSA